MLRILSIFCLVSLALAQSEDGNLDDIFEQIFATKLPVNATENKSGASTIAPPVKPPQTSDETQDLTCTQDGVAGKCVPYYLCDTADNTANGDGIGLIDVSFRDGPCLSYIDTCCPLGQKTPLTDPVIPKP